MLELLVGMLIAMFSVMAMLSLFRTTSRVTAESRVGAQQDGQLAAALLAADTAAASAGCGNTLPLDNAGLPLAACVFYHLSADGGDHRASRLR